MSPADGAGWESPCANGEEGIYTASDRALILANLVADRLEADGYVSKHVGMYAYGATSPPAADATIPFNPNIVIVIAAAYFDGNLTTDEVWDGWHDAGAASFGINRDDDNGLLAVPLVDHRNASHWSLRDAVQLRARHVPR